MSPWWEPQKRGEIRATWKQNPIIVTEPASKTDWALLLTLCCISVLTALIARC